MQPMCQRPEESRSAAEQRPSFLLGISLRRHPHREVSIVKTTRTLSPGQDPHPQCARHLVTAGATAKPPAREAHRSPREPNSGYDDAPGPRLLLTEGAGLGLELLGLGGAARLPEHLRVALERL